MIRTTSSTTLFLTLAQDVFATTWQPYDSPSLGDGNAHATPSSNGAALTAAHIGLYLAITSTAVT